MKQRCFGVFNAPVERAEVIARIALPSLRESTAVLLQSPSPALRAAAARSPILSGDPRSVPVLREQSLRGESSPVVLLARNPGAPPDVAALCRHACEAAKQRGGEWWRQRSWLAGLSGLAHLGHSAAADQAEAALNAWQAARQNRRAESESINAVLLAVAAMGPRLQVFTTLCRRLERLDTLPHAAFPLAAAGDQSALLALAEHPDTAPLLLAFEPVVAGQALARGLRRSDAGHRVLTIMMSRGLATAACRAFVEQAAAEIISGGDSELAARIVEQGLSLLPAGWRRPLLLARNPAAVRRPVLAALASTPGPGAGAALAKMLSHSADPLWVAALPPRQPGVDAVLRKHCDERHPERSAAQRARQTQMMLSLSQPPPSLVAAQLRYGRAEAIEAALRLPGAVVLLSRALKERQVWRSSVSIYNFRCSFASMERSGSSSLLRVLAADRDLRVSMLAEEALQRVPIPAPVDLACPGSIGWLQDFQAQGYLTLGSAVVEAG